MSLTGMNLKLDQRGDDVRALHTETELIGIAVPDAERQQGHFGPGTRDAVTRFQRRTGCRPPGSWTRRPSRPSTRSWRTPSTS
jgi:peptidoglycan hydrolase-like protein with peptidoglycan-binding domain